MKRPWITISAVLAFTAGGARAQSSDRFSPLFDGGVRIKGFTPESMVPIAPGKSLAGMAGLLVAGPESPAVGASMELVPVALRLDVPAGPLPAQGVSRSLGELSAKYHFYPDASFEPVRLPVFRVLPYPPAPQPSIESYLVRGQLPAPQVDSLKQDGAVAHLWQDRVTDPQALGELLSRYGSTIRAERGVRRVTVGYDCGVEGEHAHIMAHHPAIVVEADPAVGAQVVRDEVFQDVPSLALEPIVFLAR